MKKWIVLLNSMFIFTAIDAQTQVWSTFTDSIPSLSSPRLADLTNDGVLDIVIGGGTDSTFSNHGIMAFDGVNGNLLWNIPTKNEIFASAQFMDINADLIPDVFISGREAQLYAIDGTNGNIIWEFYPYATNPADSGLYNFYSPQFIPDVSGDLLPDLLVTNGGDHKAPVWDTTRPPGHLMVINSSNGNQIAKAVVPDSNETYCSPVVADIRNDGNLWVMFGTGGETLGGSMWAALLTDLLANDLSNATALVTDNDKGFIAPVSLADYSGSGSLDIIIQGYGGVISRVKGANFGLVWSTTIPDTESSAAPVLGNFYGDITPDVFCVLAKGVAPSYTDFYQVMLDGNNGNIIKKDSIGSMNFASANAFDADGDGRDEVLVSMNNYVGYFEHQLMLFDYQNNNYSNFYTAETGVNVGCTPWIGDMDNDLNLDVVYVVKKDSLNPMGWKGIYLNRISTFTGVPIAGIAWGSYMGTNYDGQYNYTPVNCGTGSILSGANITNPSCNGFSDGSILPLTGNGTPPYTYLWNDYSVGANLTNVPAGIYTLRITDASGCFELATTTLNNPFNINFGGVSNVLCPGGSNGQATVSSSGCVCMFSGCTFLWDTGNTTYTGTGLDAGPHTVTITHNNGCVVVATININDGAPLVDSVILVNVSCKDYEDGSIEIIPTNPGTTSYSWSNSVTTALNSPLAPGNYSVNIQDTRPCFDTLSFIVSEPDSLIALFSSVDILCNGDDDGEIMVAAAGGNGNYIYYAGTNNNSNGNFSPLDGGNYSVYVLDSAGCSSDTVNVNINEPTAISTTTSSTPESVAGNGTATVVISGGTSPYSQLWDDVSAQTSTTANGLTAGWYIVEITDDNGCTHIDSVEVISTIAVNDLGEEIQVLIYPNPANEKINIDLKNNPISTIELFDMQGRLVYTENCQGRDKVSLERNDLVCGNYLLRLTGEKSVYNTQVSFR